MASAGGIQLGLERVSKAMKFPIQWKPIHVAGTNGKGTICSHLSSLLRSSKVKYGRFTSPHLVGPWDSININNKTLSAPRFNEYRTTIQDSPDSSGLTSFELQTLVAFLAFQEEHVEYGIVECGLGGSRDATNVLKNKEVTIIAKIGLDHQAFLGNSLEEIAKEKAGIMEAGVPCIVDGTNEDAVLDIFRTQARKKKLNLHLTTEYPNLLADLSRENLEPHQIQNAAMAIVAYELLGLPSQARLPYQSVIDLIKKPVDLPGRLQWVDISHRHPSCQSPVLLDGAHNPQSATALAQYVNKHMRKGARRITWVIGMSKSRNPDDILGPLLQPGDYVAVAEFDAPQQMAWIKAQSTADIWPAAERLGASKQKAYSGDAANLPEIMDWAVRVADGGPIVTAGSLYLVSKFWQAYIKDRDSLHEAHVVNQPEVFKGSNTKHLYDE
jgi:dihydrofolate synthase